MFNKRKKGKNMDSNIAIPSNIPRGAPFPPPMGQIGQGFPPQMMPPAAFRHPQYFPTAFVNPAEASQKANEFARGVCVSGFESSLTSYMLEK